MLPPNQAVRVPGMGSLEMVQEAQLSISVRTKSGSASRGAVGNAVTWTQVTDIVG
jgi:mevalonate pyrophosphate decarboxylase